MNAEQNRMIEELYLEMFEKMKVYACCSLDNEALAEEAVQETFRVACQKPEQLCESENPRGWLLQTLKHRILKIQTNREIAKNLVKRYLRMHLKELSASEDELDLRLLYGDMAETEAFKLLVEMALEGRSHLEMANSRGISVGACKKRVQRARETLRKIIEE